MLCSRELDATFLLPVHGATVCWLYWCVLHIKSSKITSCNGWPASFWLLNPQVSVANNFFISKNDSFLPQFFWFFSIRTIFGEKLIWNCCKLNKERLSKNRSTFRPTFKSFFRKKFRQDRLDSWRNTKMLKGFPKYIWVFFATLRLFLLAEKQKSFRKGETISDVAWNFFELKQYFFVL